MMTVRGKTIKLFYEQGHHEGIIHAEMMNWTGYVLVAPRTSLTELYKLDNVKGAGIYFLISDEDKKVYVGETMNGVSRLRDHNIQKDFWDTLVIVQNKDLNLTKTHCSYLEHRCASIIEKESLFSLENTKSLSDYTGNLPRPDINDMEVFLENLRFLLPSLGVQVLQDVSFSGDTKKSKIVFELNTGVASAELILQDEQLILKKGALGSSKIRPSLHASIKNKREILIQKGIFTVNDKKLIANEDVKISSLSTAAAMLVGYPISGPQHWKLKGTKMTYKDWEQEQLEKID